MSRCAAASSLRLYESLRKLPAIPTSRIVTSSLISPVRPRASGLSSYMPSRGRRMRERRRRSRHNTASATIPFTVNEVAEGREAGPPGLHSPARRTHHGRTGMERSERRILTTHVGSLVRPRALVAMQTEGADAGALDAELARAVADVVRRQREVGVDIVNDGEFGKSSWASYILQRISGFEIREDVRMPLRWLGRDRERFADFFADEMPRGLEGDPTEVCVAPIEYRDARGHLARDIRNLRRAADLAGAPEVFMTAVAPASAAYNGINEHYPSERDFVLALAD